MTRMLGGEVFDFGRLLSIVGGCWAADANVVSMSMLKNDKSEVSLIDLFSTLFIGRLSPLVSRAVASSANCPLEQISQVNVAIRSKTSLAILPLVCQET